MNIIQCLHPQLVYNKSTKEKIYVPCGKCPACRRSQNSIWVQRLQQEQLCWPYTVFCTLTYSDFYVHTLSFNKNDNTLVDTADGFCLSCSDIPNFNYKDKLFLHKKVNIHYVSKQDVQKFLKRLRYYIDELLSNPLNIKTYGAQSKTLRYFICSEYGPTTFRPHYHCLFFFGSSLAAANFSTLLSKAWKFGISDFSFVSNSGASSRYVAQYLNCVTSLPKIYSHPEIRPFVLCSKHPAIGTLQIKNEEVQQIFHCSAPVRSIYQRSSNEYVDIPLWRSIQDKLFPQLAGFDLLNHDGRIAAYGLFKYSGSLSFAEFKSYFENIIKEKTNVLDLVSSCYSGLQYLVDIYSKCTLLNSDYPLKRLYLISKRVCLQSEVFGVSLSYYVSRIEDYYSNKAYYKLKKWMEFQQEFSKYHNINLVLFSDCNYLMRFNSRVINTNDGSVASDIDKLIFSGFNLDANFFVGRDLYEDVEKSNEYAVFCEDLNYYLHKSTKTKRKNEYLELHPEYKFI